MTCTQKTQKPLRTKEVAYTQFVENIYRNNLIHRKILQLRAARKMSQI